MTPIKKVLCPIDCSEGSRAALEYAHFIAKHFGAELHVIHAWHVSHHVRPDLSVWMEAQGQKPITAMIAASAKEETERFLATLAPEVAAMVKAHVVEGEPAPTIAAFADTGSFDLIVMGTHGRTGLAHLALGSVAEKVVRRAHRPVLTVPVPKER